MAAWQTSRRHRRSAARRRSGARAAVGHLVDKSGTTGHPSDPHGHASAGGMVSGIVASTPGDVEMVEVVASPPEVNAEDRQSLGADPDSADSGTTTGEDNNDEPVPTMGEKRASFVATV